MSAITFYSLCFLASILIIRYLKSFNPKLPPGPRGVPLFGNIFQLRQKAWHLFDEWKGKYGPIMCIHILGTPVIILNTQEVATELMHRRAANYSDRARNIVAGEYVSHGLTLALTQYGPLWRRLRRASHSALKSSTSKQYCSSQSTEALLLAYDILHTSQSWIDNIQQSTASSITNMVYDRPRLKSGQDPAVKQLNDMAHQFEHDMYPGAHLVELLPILEYMPACLARWKRDAQARYHSYTALFMSYLGDVKERMRKSQQGPCACASMIEQSNDLNDKELAWLSAVLYIAGFDTTNSTLQWFIYSMILHPAVQKAAQRELDQVVGRSRPPTFADMEQLPYICALVKEVLRWRPSVALGIPHAVLDNDWYEGYFIPKGALCVANIWSMNHDQDIYGPDANLFKPERYLGESGNLKENGEGHVTFGLGRRICVGRHVASNSLFITIAILLWATTIEPEKDEDGNPLMPDESGEEGIGAFSRPPSVKCNIQPRFPDVKIILQQERDMILCK